MRVVLDIETNGLHFPLTIWCVVVKDMDSGVLYKYNYKEGYAKLKELSKNFTLVVGHNAISFDVRVLNYYMGDIIDPAIVHDTLVISRLYKYDIPGGHSLDNWGRLLKFPKIDYNDWTKYSQEMLDYCVQDVELTHRLYDYLMLKMGKFPDALECEHKMERISQQMSSNGFKFNMVEAQEIYKELEDKATELLNAIKQEFKPRSKLIREITPSLTKNGTLHKKDFKWYEGTDYTVFSEGAPFSLVEFTEFNPGSPKQVVERLNEAGWRPVEKTKGHIEAKKNGDKQRLQNFEVYGWKVSENNLATLPEDAPPASRLLIKWLVYETRLRKLREWFGAYDERDGRIHGNFLPIGTYTHRMSHQKPNMGNISAAKSIKYHTKELNDLATDLGKRMRSLWVCDDDAYLVGTDMEGAHLRLFAHMINDENFIDALVNGDKSKGTDPHTMNMKALGHICPTRDLAKTFIFTFLNGGGVGKVMEIFNCSKKEASEALRNYVSAYPGLQELRTHTVPKDAAQGYFLGLDGRPIICDSEHHMMAAYLQSGEAIVMKHANVLWYERLQKEGIKFKQVNLVHDEFQTEVYGGLDVAKYVAKVQCEAIKEVGERLNLRCPLEGDWDIGKNWYETH